MADNPPHAPKRKSKARKFYAISPDYRRGGIAGFRIENREKLLQGLLVLGPPSGRRGFPDYPEPPRVLIDKKIGRPLRDIEQCSGYWLISDPMKAVLEEVDREAFAFVQCEVQRPPGESEPGYWLCDVIRILDALDESASDVKIYDENGIKTYSLLGAHKLVFNEATVGSAHAFRMSVRDPLVICDQQVKDACGAAGVKGAYFRDAANW